MVPEKHFIFNDGYCHVHAEITVADVDKAKKEHPQAIVLAHPECHNAVSDMADYVGSTTGIMNYAKNSNEKSFIIATEQGVVDRLKRDFAQKEFILVKNNIVCPNMKMTSLEDILNVLTKGTNEIFVDEKIASKAVKCIDRMLEVSR